MQSFGFQLAFPKRNGVPSKIPQFNPSFQIPLLVAANFILPERCVCFGQDKVFAVLMSMPEATVDKNGCTVFFEDNVGRTGKFLYIETVSESFGEQEFAHKEFGLCILAPYSLHALAPLLGIHSVCHIVKVCKN